MFPDNPFLQLTLARASSLLWRLPATFWTEAAQVECHFAGSTTGLIPFEDATRRSFERVQLPFHWGRLFEQGWFRLDLPDVAGAGPLYLHWQDQGEGTAYVDGVPYYGFDVAHRHCALPVGTRQVFMESLCLQSAIWHPEATGMDAAGSLLSAARLMRRNDLAWGVYHDLRALYDLAIEECKAAQPTLAPMTSGFGYHPPLDVIPVLCRRLLRVLDDAVNAHDQGGLAACKEVLAAAYARFAGQHERVRAALTGHAHIDLVWMWPERSAEYKAVHTFSTMNRLMDLYPEMRFSYSQPASYEAVGRMSPALLDAVRARIGEGKWEAAGAMEVESDTLLACGEALARSFMVGQAGFTKIQGRPSRVCWLPDVFGYCGCLPQIMRQIGVDFFFTTKLTWSNINLFPYSSFVWRGSDGSEVVVHVTQDNGYNQVAGPEELRRGARAYRQSDVHDEFLAPTGYGDGGGGVTEEMCERARRYSSLAGMPEVGWTRLEDFFVRLDAVRAKLPAYQGELYLEYHRGVLTTHGDLKAVFRAAERALQVWEAVRCATGGGEIDARAWKRVIFAQFHDYIPGSSIWEVYEEGLPELRRIAADALASSARELGADGGKSGIFNPLPVARNVLVREADGRAVQAVEMAPLQGAPLDSLRALPAVPPFVAEAGRLGNDMVATEFDASGQISRLTFGGYEVPLRAALGELVLYPDVPHQFDAWELDRQTLSLGRTVDARAELVAAHAGPLEATVEFRRVLTARSSVLVRYRVDACEPVLHIEYEVDWHEEQTLLKTIFPTVYAGRQARFGAPFGSVLRGQQAGSSADEARFEGAGSRWAVVGDDDGEGLGVVTEAKYGWSCRDGALGLSLLRAPVVTGHDGGHSKMFPAALRQPRADGVARPVHTDQGKHVIRLALCLHGLSRPAARNAAALADTLFTPAISFAGKAISTGFAGLDNAGSLVACWAKPAADGRGWILRLHETLGRRGTAQLRLAGGVRAFRTDLSENDGGSEVSEVAYAPYELMSVRIR